MLLTQLVPLALVVAWSPVKIVPAFIVVINSPRPKAASLAFLLASLAALALCTAVFAIEVPGVLHGLDDLHLGWGPFTRIGAGVAFLVLGGYVWRKRQSRVRAPDWVSKLAHITPAVAGVLGVVLTVTNLKVMAATAAAGMTIGTAALDPWGIAAAIGIYTAVAGSTLMVAVIGYLLAAERVDRWAASLRRWIQRNQGPLTAILLSLVGFTLVSTGVASV